MKALTNLNKKYLITPKLLYLFINLQHYTLHKFRGLFARTQFEVDDKSLGRYFGLLLCLTFFTNIFIASLNDKFGRPKLLMVSALAISCAFFQLFFFKPYITLAQGMFWVNLFAYLIFNTPVPALLDKIVLEYLSKRPNTDTKAYGKQRIWGTLGYTLSAFLIEASISVGSSKGKYNFNNLAIYSLVTTAVAASMAFLFIDVSTPSNTERQVEERVPNSETQQNTVENSAQDAEGQLAVNRSSNGDQGNPSAESGPEREESRRDAGSARAQSVTLNFGELLKNTEYLYFIGLIFLNGLTRAGMSIYLTIYSKEILQVKGYAIPDSWPWPIRLPLVFLNQSPISTISIFEAVFEMLILFYSDRITTKIGYLWPLLLAQVAQLVRFVCYYMLDWRNPHTFAYCCLFELAKGVNFGLTHSSGVQLAVKMCPPHLKATSQMIYQGVFTAIGSAAAGQVFGALFDQKSMQNKALTIQERVGGYRKFFALNIVITLLTIVLFFYKYWIRDNLLFNSANAAKKLNQKHLAEDQSDAVQGPRVEQQKSIAASN